MENRNQTSRPLSQLLLISAVMLALTTLASTTLSAPVTSPKAPQPMLVDDVVLQVELVTVVPSGFEPAELTRPAGKFVLEVNNRSEVDEVELRLDRQAGGREATVTLRSTSPDWRTELDLLPGVYTLSEASHANWICRITITAN